MANFNNNNNSRGGNNRGNTNNRPRQQRPEPVYTEYQKVISEMFVNMMEDYLGAISSGNVEDRRALDNKLFNMDPESNSWCTVIQLDETETDPPLIYKLDRSVRTDRTTGELIRASCTYVVINKEGVPVYYIYAFITNKHTGSVSVVPMDPQRGPVHNNALRATVG